MSIYRSLLAAIAAFAVAAPVFADTNAQTNQAAQHPAAAAAQQVATAEQIKTNINKATAKELMKIKGMNASKARAIVAYRKKHGDFKSLDDLSSVKGFKKMKPDNLKEIQDQLSVE